MPAELWHVIDRRDNERVAGGFSSCAEAEAWIEKTDRRGSGEFEARESLPALTPAQVDTAWAEAVEPFQRKLEAANALDAQAERYRKAGGNWAATAEKKAQQAHEMRVAAHEARAEVEKPFRAEWDNRHGWSRAYIVPDGHIHRSTACRTLYPTTVIRWLPELSGSSEDQIVAAAGVHACTVCYPSAPVEELRAAELAAKRATQCPGSGTYDHDSSGLRYASPRARCNHCGQTVSATSTGKLRAHKPKEAS